MEILPARIYGALWSAPAMPASGRKPSMALFTCPTSFLLYMVEYESTLQMHWEQLKMRNLYFSLWQMTWTESPLRGGWRTFPQGHVLNLFLELMSPTSSIFSLDMGESSWYTLLSLPLNTEFISFCVCVSECMFICVCKCVCSCDNLLPVYPFFVTSCWSFLGQTGGNQILSLQTPGCMRSGVAAHELMQALGFVHEQSRSDRDNYITIVWKNIMAGQHDWPFQHCYEGFQNYSAAFSVYLTDQLHNFRKQVTNNLNSPYDYGSLMHYGRWAALQGLRVCLWKMLHIMLNLGLHRYAFSEDGGPTIIPKPDPYIPIGQRDGPSHLDLHKINTLYDCGRLNHTYWDIQLVHIYWFDFFPP